MSKTKTKDKQNFNDLLKSLESHHETSTVDLHVPSCNDTKPFKRLTVNQQSKILNGSITQEINQNAFSYNRIISSIILENTSEPLEINLIDKIPLAIQLRVNTIGPTIDIEGITYDIKTHVEQLAEDTNSLAEYALGEQEFTTDTNITIIYTSPTLDLDMKINQAAEKKWATEAAENIISELFKVEMAKYIKSIHFEDGEIVFDNLNFEQRIKVCDTLPMSCSAKLVEFIETVRGLDTAYNTISGAEIPTDASLFGA